MALSFTMPTPDIHGRETTEHGTPFFPYACYIDELATNPVPWHWHDEMEAVVVEKGECVFLVGSEHIHMKEGDGIYINPGILHAVADPRIDTSSDYDIPTDCVLHSSCFLPRLIGGSPESVFWQNYIQPLISDVSFFYFHFSPEIPWQKSARDAIANAWQICADDSRGFEFGVRNYLSQLTLILTENKPIEKTRPSEKHLRDAERIKTMLQYIHEHFSEELDTSAIAASALISASECLRCFHNTIGTTPIQYVKQYRIQHAAKLLSSTHLKITDIGSLCGFQEMSYFSKTFRESMGCTPKEYRKSEQHNSQNSQKEAPA